jgi:putative salt-induced outer membrane protein YdiY
MQDPPPAPTTAWKGSVNLGAYLFDGNTERRGANLGAKAERRSEHERTTATFSWDYAEDREPMIAGWSLRQRRVDGSLQEDYFLTKKTYLFVTTSATGDWRADLDLRFTVGAGVGHQWADEKDFSFKTEVGLSYVREDFRSGAPTNEYLAARLAYGLEWQISKSTRLLQDVEALPSIEDASDITLTKSTRLQVSLSESMVSEFKWELDYDNTPSPGLERVDNRFFITLGWNF